MLNINAARANRSRGPEGDRKARIEDIRAHMAVLRAAAEQGRLRRLLRQSVSLQHVHVLTVLRASGPLTVGELARALDVSVASATGIVSRMEQRDLVARTRSEQDRRVVTVSLERGGRAALDQLEGPAREKFTAMLETLSLDELDAVQAAFQALRGAHEALQGGSLTA
jgi:DNA-binding MarR family transcriptional regulator